MEYFLIRHTKPDIETGICYGALDVNVSASFNDEAEQVLRTCRQENISAHAIIFSSPLKRCRLLAEFLGAQLNIPVTFDDRLQELNFGEWEGKRWDEIDRVQSDFWTADVVNRAPPGGETYAALSARVCECVGAGLLAIEAATNQEVIIISHGGPIRALLAQLLGLTKKTFPPLDVAMGRVSKVSKADSANGGGVLQFLNR